jgi:hypothetical protein
MKLKHILAVTAITLLAGHQAIAGRSIGYTLNNLTVALTYTTEGDYTEQNINLGSKFETPKQVLKIGNKQILDMLVDEGRIETAKGYSIQVMTYTGEGASVEDTYVVDQAGNQTNISDFLDFSVINDSDSGENVVNNSGKNITSKGNTIGSGDFSYTGQGQVWLQFYDLFVTTLEGTYESNHHWDSNENMESYVSYTKSAEMSNASGEAFTWYDWFEWEEYYFEGVVKGSFKVASSKDFISVF